jgi:hypothetical protein
MRRALTPAALLATLLALATPAGAITERNILRLDVRIEDKAEPDGLKRISPRLSTLLTRFKRAKWACKLDTYEYGGNIVCIRPGAEAVYIDMVTEPSRAPEFVRIDSVRPDGKDGRQLPADQFFSFIEGMTRR